MDVIITIGRYLRQRHLRGSFVLDYDRSVVVAYLDFPQAARYSAVQHVLLSAQIARMEVTEHMLSSTVVAKVS